MGKTEHLVSFGKPSRPPEETRCSAICKIRLFYSKVLISSEGAHLSAFVKSPLLARPPRPPPAASIPTRSC